MTEATANHGGKMNATGAQPPVLVITGGSTGIGLATAKRFAAAGHKVVNLSRSPIPMEDAVHITVDFADPNWTDRAAAPLHAAVPEGAQICLVHNSAYKSAGDIASMDAATLRTAFEINAVAPALLNHLLLPRMAAGSSIIYIGSTLSYRATRGMAAYVMSKHAIAGLMRSTAQDLAGQRIHTVCVCPGFTNTEMLRNYGGEALSQLASLLTQNRLIEPEEIAETIFHAGQSPVLNGSMVLAELGFIEP